MNTKRLKIIAIISMLIDHIPRIIPQQMWIAIAESISLSFPGKEELVSEIVIDRVPSIMGYIGRLAAPIFMFCITVGFRYTKDIKKYILRVFTFAFISQIPYILFTQSEEYASGFSKLEVTPFYKIDLNIMFTLGLGLVALYFYEKLKNKNFILPTTQLLQERFADNLSLLQTYLDGNIIQYLIFGKFPWLLGVLIGPSWERYIPEFIEKLKDNDFLCMICEIINSSSPEEAQDKLWSMICCNHDRLFYYTHQNLLHVFSHAGINTKEDLGREGRIEWGGVR